MVEHEALSRFDAQEDWKRARRKVLYDEVMCFFRQCSVDLLSFEDVRAGLHLDQRIERGLQEIPLDRIKGSVGRYDDFTTAFLPRKKHMRQRWERVGEAMKAGKTPPIDVYQVGESYFVIDGNHRVSIARQRGLKKIQAYVSEFLTPVGLSPEADLDELLIKSEQVEFLETVGAAGPPAVREIAFTCPACYTDLTSMIEGYRHGLERKNGEPVSADQAVSAWYEEVYAPAIKMIRENDLLARTASRTEADLFLWAWKNNKLLEELVRENGNPADGD